MTVSYTHLDVYKRQGFIQLYLDEELMYGATIQITYKMQMLDTLGAQQEAEIGILTKRFLRCVYETVFRELRQLFIIIFKR